MRCKACNSGMSDFEATRKIVTDSGKIEYPDLCNRCFKESGLGDIFPVVERHDLSHDYDVDENE